MSSIKYEILSKCPGFKGSAPGPSKNTIEQYKTHAIRYGQWAKKKYGCRRFEEFKDHIQDYADDLCEKGRRPATIHTYIAACCYVWDIPIQQNTPADIRYSFLFAELPRTEDAIHPPAAWVRIAASMS